MNGNKLIKYLGFPSNHPDLQAFLEQQEIDTALLPDLSLPEKKLDQQKLVTYKDRGVSLQFERTHTGGGLYLERVLFFNRKEDALKIKPKLPFDLHFMDPYRQLQQLLGPKVAHGDPKKLYFEEDESDYHHQGYQITVYFERSDLEEKLQELAVSLSV